MPASAAFVLVGPTAVGKSAVAHHLAREDGYDILSADSMAIYRGLDIGTAKPGVHERAEVKYAGLDLAEPGETFSVGAYVTHARVAADASAQRGRPLLVVGGTGLYIKCLTVGLREAPAADPELRTRLEHLLAREGVAGLQAELNRLAPEHLRALADPRNPRRLIRALELAALGQRLPEAKEAVKPRLLGLRAEPAELERRVAARVAEMYERGLLDEVRALRERGVRLSATAEQAIGYAEAFGVLDGLLTEEQARLRTQLRTRQLAKRQMTWFRHQATMTWLDVSSGRTVPDLASSVRSHWRLHGPTPLAI
jgi:tRNA dimethylallyltransferase